MCSKSALSYLLCVYSLLPRPLKYCRDCGPSGYPAPPNKTSDHDSYQPGPAKSFHLSCDSGRHLQECRGAQARKFPKECFLSVFGHLARSARKSARKSAFQPFFRKRKEHISINKFAGLSRDGGEQNNVYVFFWGHALWGETNT